MIFFIINLIMNPYPPIIPFNSQFLMIKHFSCYKFIHLSFNVISPYISAFIIHAIPYRHFSFHHNTFYRHSKFSRQVIISSLTHLHHHNYYLLFINFQYLFLFIQHQVQFPINIIISFLLYDIFLEKKTANKSGN